MPSSMNRRQLLKNSATLVGGLVTLPGILWAQSSYGPQTVQDIFSSDYRTWPPRYGNGYYGRGYYGSPYYGFGYFTVTYYGAGYMSVLYGADY